MELSFILNAILAGLGIALMAGPLGCFLVWKRLAFFGDTLAHSALFGITISLFFHVDTYLGLIICCLLIVIVLGLISAQKKISYDTILGVISHFTLALGLILITLIKDVQVNLLGLLYGDILTITSVDLLWIFSIDIIALLVLVIAWPKLLNITVCKDIAKVEGISTTIYTWILFFVMALVFAIAVKLAGVLLVTALLIIPAAAARFLAKSPEQMCIFAILVGAASVLLGINFSVNQDWPTGPAIVFVSALAFLGSFLLSKFRIVG